MQINSVFKQLEANRCTHTVISKSCRVMGRGRGIASKSTSQMSYLWSRHCIAVQVCVCVCVCECVCVCVSV